MINIERYLRNIFIIDQSPSGKGDSPAIPDTTSPLTTSTVSTAIPSSDTTTTSTRYILGLFYLHCCLEITDRFLIALAQLWLLHLIRQQMQQRQRLQQLPRKFLVI